MKVLLLHHTHPEGYPPTFNAINCIAEKVEQLTILSTDTLPTKWNYKENTELILLKSSHNRFEAVKRSKFEKIKSYLSYTYNTYKLLKTKEFQLLIIYDNVPFLFYILASKFLSKKVKIWFHNHDVYPLSHYKKYSVNWFAAKSVQNNFNKIDFFSLPAVERKKMYPLKNYKGKFFFIPNYPSTKVINIDESIVNKRDRNTIKIVYPGSPSHKNGFEELINILDHPILNRKVELTIVGDTHPKTKKRLTDLAQNKNVDKQLFFENRIPYTLMPSFLQKFHIGWAVYKPVDLSVATAGSSSNKIYEFLANALPIIVFDNEHHKEHLKNCKSAFYTNLSDKSIINEIKSIMSQYGELIKNSRAEFESKYQFENVFNKAFDEIVEDLNL